MWSINRCFVPIGVAPCSPPPSPNLPGATSADLASCAGGGGCTGYHAWPQSCDHGPSCPGGTNFVQDINIIVPMSSAYSHIEKHISVGKPVCNRCRSVQRAAVSPAAGQIRRYFPGELVKFFGRVLRFFARLCSCICYVRCCCLSLTSMIFDHVVSYRTIRAGTL